MSKIFSRISLEHLINWIFKEYETENQIFGIHKSLFYSPSSNDKFTIYRYDTKLETPIGVAAGPHTQMAQNIISAWLCGARYIELKTVQTLDELDVSKPCIDAADEGYNCEWSQELKLTDSFDEYLNAWIVLHILRHKFGYNSNERGFIFNMSVGYNLDGIKKTNVQQFLDKMQNAEKEIKEKISKIRSFYPKIDDIEIPYCISNNITLSTMHGCPPDEIEKIARYLIEDRNLHTTIKLNPTLLGPELVRYILNEKLQYKAIVPDEAFDHDLKYNDAIQIIKSLQNLATKKGLQFSIKLTNTLECINNKNVLPPNEKMMYMSGRALHPISINLACKLQNDFNGDLDISFCAGVDCFNLPKVIACGLKPVTVCTDILKPGGYSRLLQYLEELNKAMIDESANNIDDFIVKFANINEDNVKRASLINLRRYSATVIQSEIYNINYKTGTSVKTERELTKFDCIKAPCITTCPVAQDIPTYLYYTSKGDYKTAYEVILRTNPFPNVLGNVCDHHCQHKCTRSNYDNSILIREVKRFIAYKNQNEPFKLTPAKSNGKKVAIIGAGPSGLAAAYFLALEGFKVTVFETKSFAGGMIGDAIPAFRLNREDINKDIDRILKLGVNIKYNQKINKDKFEKIKKEFDYIYIATGAQNVKKLNIPGEQSNGVIQSLNFLSDVLHNKQIDIGPKVLIIGGGNTAIDSARTAKRLLKNTGNVTIVYRRTISDMPAEKEEIEAAINEGIQILELLSPEKIVANENGKVEKLICSKMKLLNDFDKDGRRKTTKIENEFVEIQADTIIIAIGQEFSADFISAKELSVNPETNETNIPNVYAGGDAVRGPANIVKAIADAKKFAKAIMIKAGIKHKDEIHAHSKDLKYEDYLIKASKKIPGLRLKDLQNLDCFTFNPTIRLLTEDEAKKESLRCLHCNDICNVCVTVCPNRANRAYTIDPLQVPIYKALYNNSTNTYTLEKLYTKHFKQKIQTLNIADFCNECGNCTTFCPTKGSPYKDKPKFYLTHASFNNCSEGYYLQSNILFHKYNNIVSKTYYEPNAIWYEDKYIKARIHPVTLEVESVLPINQNSASQQTNITSNSFSNNTLNNNTQINILSNNSQANTPYKDLPNDLTLDIIVENALILKSLMKAPFIESNFYSNNQN